MKFIGTMLSTLLIIITPLISFVTFDGIGYKYIDYVFNLDGYSNLRYRAMIGESVNLISPMISLENRITVTSGVGYIINTFEGWYLDKGFTSSIEKFYMPKHDVRVYGNWSLYSWAGNSINNYLFNMIYGQKYTINVTYTGGQFFILKFIPAKSQQYTFISSSTLGTSSYQDTKAYLYESSLENQIAFNDDWGTKINGHFHITYNLVFSQTYYLKVQYDKSQQTGRFDVSVT
jgi:uncharacterized repeat protein (TIGR02543 family)